MPHAGELTLAVRVPDGLELALAHDRVEARFTVAAGQRVVLGVIAAERDPLYVCDIGSIEQRIAATAGIWRHWWARCGGPGRAASASCATPP